MHISGTKTEALRAPTALLQKYEFEKKKKTKRSGTPQKANVINVS